MPPLVMAEVKETPVPAQTVVMVVEIEMVGATVPLTVTVIVFEVPVAAVIQPALEVSTQLIWSLLTKAALLKVAALAPLISAPFFFH